MRTIHLVGAIGIDVNEDHLAVAETDRFGNLVGIRRIGLNLYGKSEEQAKAIIGNTCQKIAKTCAETGKPLVIERLNLRRRRAGLSWSRSIPSGRERSLPSPTPRRSQC
ncbi:hypothetical protein [Verrucomicrobium sp. 3C]|uniref:hypothetical protein n=1 Tax=Verrucomicrobium sp. 3C TaxID=1134055 RepID=UPI00047564AC|nr:hypothetical protein [Verrucomicrobium sp. 3C]